MSTPIESYERDEFRVTIYPELEPSSPREWSNVGTLLAEHRRYSFGDARVDSLDLDLFSSWDEVAEALRRYEDARVVLPVYLYDHSGLRMSVTPFGDPWDSGQLGVIYATAGQIRDRMECKRVTARVLADVEASLRSEIEAMDQYVSGDVYEVRVIDGDGVTVESIGDVYGLEHARDVADDIIAQERTHADLRS